MQQRFRHPIWHCQRPVKWKPLLEGLLPNETYCYQLLAEDANAKSPEPLETELASFTTGLVPPILEEPQAQFEADRWSCSTS